MPRHARAASHPIEVRRANLGLVLNAALTRSDPFTRADLIADTGLSAPTIGSLVAELLRLDLLHDLGAGASHGGRRPSLLEFNARYGLLVAIDIGPTRTRLAISDARQTILGHRVVTTPGGREPRRTLEQLALEVYRILADHHLASDPVLAVAVGAPGVVNEHTGVVVTAPSLPGWHDVQVREVLQPAFGPPVLVANDVHLALIGEHERGAARGHARCAFISVGTAIGAAVLVNGAVDRGQHFMAGQIGFMCMGAAYVNTDFGDHGCLATLAGLRSLAEKVPQASDGDPATWVARIVEAADRGEPEARAALLETTHLVGIAAANLAAVVDPSIMVFGGALFARAPQLVATVGAVVQSIWHAPLTIVPSALENEAPLWGGLIAAQTGAWQQLQSGVWARGTTAEG